MNAKLVLTFDDSRLKALGAAVHRELATVVEGVAHGVAGHAAAAIREPGRTGRIYELGETEVSFKTKSGDAVSFTARKGKEGKQHQASAPGEAPANETDNLALGIKAIQVSELAWEVVANAEYAAALEFGTDDGKIAPRPFLGPALESVREAFTADVRDALKRVSG